MNNLCITNYAMIFMFIIIILLIINQKNISKNKENFVLGSTDLTNLRTEINRIYDMDVDAIRYLGAISKSLLTGTNTSTTYIGKPGTLTISANNTILRGITFDNSTFEKTHNSSGKGNSVGYIVSDNDKDKKLMIVGNNTAGSVRKVGIWDELQVHGNAGISGNLQIDGNITVKGTLHDKYYPVGVEQTYKDMIGMTYSGWLKIGTGRVNKSGRPIQVCISYRSAGDSVVMFYIDYQIISRRSQRSGIGCGNFNIIVPNGTMYGIASRQLTNSNWSNDKVGHIVSWYELSTASVDLHDWNSYKSGVYN